MKLTYLQGLTCLQKASIPIAMLAKILRSFLIGSFFFSGVCQAQTSVEEFLSKWENSMVYTLEVLQAMPDSGLDHRVHAEAMSFREHLKHIGDTFVRVSQGYLEGESRDFSLGTEAPSREELAEFLRNTYAYAASTIRNLSPDQLAEKQEVFGQQLSRRQVMAMILDHATHHRGAAVSSLRAQGVKPPRYIGF